jgi:hypothetical protein
MYGFIGEHTSLEAPISVWPVLGLSPSPSQYKLLRDRDLSTSWSPTSSRLVGDFPTAASTSVWVFSSFLRHYLCYTGGLEAAQRFAYMCRQGMHKEEGAEIFKKWCFISFACKDVLVRDGFG